MRIAAGAALVLIVMTAACGGSSSLDASGAKACATVQRLDAGGDSGLIDSVVDELTAVRQAAASSNGALHAAAVKQSSASSLPPTNPLYVNPGDVEYAAVAAWCRQHS